MSKDYNIEDYWYTDDGGYVLDDKRHYIIPNELDGSYLETDGGK